MSRRAKTAAIAAVLAALLLAGGYVAGSWRALPPSGRHLRVADVSKSLAEIHDRIAGLEAGLARVSRVSTEVHREPSRSIVSADRSEEIDALVSKLEKLVEQAARLMAVTPRSQERLVAMRKQFPDQNLGALRKLDARLEAGDPARDFWFSSRADVIQRLGTPIAILGSADREHWEYGKEGEFWLNVYFTDGVVVRLD